MNIQDVSELENILLRFEGIRDLLCMLADCTLEGAQSIEQYGAGINLIFNLSSENTTKLRKLFDKVHLSKEVS